MLTLAMQFRTAVGVVVEVGFTTYGSWGQWLCGMGLGCVKVLDVVGSGGGRSYSGDLVGNVKVNSLPQTGFPDEAALR